MKYRIEKRYPYSDTHCSGKSEPYLALVDENGREIGHFKKFTYPSDTHCVGHEETYKAFVDENGREIGYFKKFTYPSDTHCSGHEETYEAFVENIYSEPITTKINSMGQKSKIKTIRKK